MTPWLTSIPLSPKGKEQGDVQVGFLQGQEVALLPLWHLVPWCLRLGFPEAGPQGELMCRWFLWEVFPGETGKEAGRIRMGKRGSMDVISDQVSEVGMILWGRSGVWVTPERRSHLQAWGSRLSYTGQGLSLGHVNSQAFLALCNSRALWAKDKPQKKVAGANPFHWSTPK